jgi:hypothetical protein
MNCVIIASIASGLNYLTSNVNSFFLAKSQFMWSSEGIKEKLPIKNDEEGGLFD